MADDDDEPVRETTEEDRAREREIARSQQWNFVRFGLRIILGPWVRAWEQATARERERQGTQGEAGQAVATVSGQQNHRRVEARVEFNDQHDVQGASTESPFDLNTKVTLAIKVGTEKTSHIETKLRPCDVEFMNKNPDTFTQHSSQLYEISYDNFTEQQGQLLRNPLNALSVLRTIVQEHERKKGGSGVPGTGDEGGNANGPPNRQLEQQIAPWVPIGLTRATGTRLQVALPASGTGSTSLQSMHASSHATGPNHTAGVLGSSIAPRPAANALVNPSNADTRSNETDLSGQEGVAGLSVQASEAAAGDWECDRSKEFKKLCKRQDESQPWIKTDDSATKMKEWKEELQAYQTGAVPMGKHTTENAGTIVWNNSALLIIARLCKADQGGNWENACSFCKPILQTHITRQQQPKRANSTSGAGGTGKKPKTSANAIPKTSPNASSDDTANANSQPTADNRDLFEYVGGGPLKSAAPNLDTTALGRMLGRSRP